MAAISFKNVGEKTEDVRARERARRTSSLPIGIVTPVRAGDEAEGIFKMHRTLAGQLRDNFRNLLMTNHGDRVVLYDYGANLQPLTFELTNQEDFDTRAMLRIKRAVDKYMSFITLVDFESRIVFPGEEKSVGRVDITIRYNVDAAAIEDDTITVAFFIGG